MLHSHHDDVKQRPVYLVKPARVRPIMRGTAATLAAGALLVLFWWMAAIVSREHGTYAR